MGHRNGDDRGAAAVEAALLLVGVAAVLVPVAFAVGSMVLASFESTTCSFEQRSAGQPCVAVSSGGGAQPVRSGGAGQGGSPTGPGQTAPTSEQLEAWVGSRYPEATDVRCPVLSADPRTPTECTVTEPSRSLVVTVRLESDGGLTVLAQAPVAQ